MKLKYIILAVLSGLLLILAFPNFYIHIIIWIALSPLLFVVLRASSKQAFAYGFICGLVFFAGHLYWLLELFVFVKYVIVLAWLALSITQALTFAIFASLAGYFLKKQSFLFNILVIPSLWVILEYLRSIGPWGFSWGVLGYSQQPSVVVFQITKITGVLGVSFLIVLVNVFVLGFFEYFFLRRKEIVRAGLMTFLILLVTLGLSIMLSPKGNREKFFRVVLVQASIPQEEKWKEAYEEDIVSTHARLTAKVERFKPFLVVWPETAIPEFVNREVGNLRKVKSLSRSLGSYLLFGGLYLDKRGNQFNSAFLVSPRGQMIRRYDKIRLALFGEYIPNLPFFSSLRTIAGLGENLTPGKRIVALPTSQGNLGAVICFESADFSLCRKMVKKGAHLLVVITNDAWFGRSAASTQHLQISATRAAENGVYVVQAANSGISAIVDPNGQIREKTNLLEKTALVGRAAFITKKTFYNQVGDVFSYLCAILVILDFLFLGFVKGRAKQPA